MELNKNPNLDNQPSAMVAASQSVNTPTIDPNQQMMLMIGKMQTMMENQKNEMEKEKMREEIERLKEKQRESETREMREMLQMNMHVGLHNLSSNKNGGGVNINNNNNNNNNNNLGGGQAVVVNTTYVVDDGRLTYPFGMYCLFLLLNLILPGVGSILAGILYGKTSKRGDRTGNIICHGIGQLIFAITIFGWIWAIRDALNYFALGSCPACACFD